MQGNGIGVTAAGAAPGNFDGVSLSGGGERKLHRRQRPRAGQPHRVEPAPRRRALGQQHQLQLRARQRHLVQCGQRRGDRRRGQRQHHRRHRPRGPQRDRLSPVRAVAAPGNCRAATSLAKGIYEGACWKCFPTPRVGSAGDMPTGRTPRKGYRRTLPSEPGASRSGDESASCCTPLGADPTPTEPGRARSFGGPELAGCLLSHLSLRSSRQAAQVYEQASEAPALTHWACLAAAHRLSTRFACLAPK